MTTPARPAGLAAWIGALPEATALTMVAVIPAFLNLSSSHIFEEEKALLLRAGALLVLSGAAWRWRGRVAMLRQPAVLTFGLLILGLVLATVFGIAPAEALGGAAVRRHGLLTWLALGVVFCEACVIATSEAGRRRLLAALVAGSVWPSIHALVQAAGMDPVQWTGTVVGRAAGTLGNPLLMAGYLAVVVPLTASQVRRAPGYAVCLLLQLAALAATGSRGPVLALGAGAVVFGAVFYWAPRYRRVTGVSLVALALLGGTLLVVPQVRPSAVERLFDIRSGSGRVRVLIWHGVRQVVDGSGWRLWLGHGPESLHRVFPRFYVPEIGRIEGTEAMPDRAHNETLDMLVNAGAVGVMLQFAFFVTAVVAALRTEDRWLRAGLAGAIVAHVLETQLGIATVASRLTFLVAVAIAAHRSPAAAPQKSHRGEMAPPTPWAALTTAAAVGAAAPLVATVAAAMIGDGGTGDASQLQAYVTRLSLVSPILYASVLLAAGAVARVLSTGGIVGQPGLRGALMVAAVAAAVPLAVTPSMANVITRAGMTFERSGRPSEARIAYAEAHRLLPNEEASATNLGRVLMEEATRLEGGARATTFASADEVLQRAEQLNQQDPYPPRNRASLARVQARAVPAGDREGLLNDADSHYRRATELAPGLPGLWVEWANVDAERRRFVDADTKLARAEALDADRYDLWLLRGLLRAVARKPDEAVTAFGRALDARPGDVAALRGRASALAQAGRQEEARADVDGVLRLSPGDGAALRLRTELAVAAPARP